MLKWPLVSRLSFEYFFFTDETIEMINNDLNFSRILQMIPFLLEFRLIELEESSH